mgnify:CR=1 FL=1
MSEHLPTPAPQTGPPIFVVSGGDGQSGEHLARTILAQYERVDVPIIVRRNVRSESQLQEIVEEARHTKGFIVHTLVNETLRETLNFLVHQYHLPAFDLAGPLLAWYTAALGQAPLGEPGRYRQQREEYFRRVEAMDYTVSHDDGRNPSGWSQAEIVLVGVSRVGKTPLSRYLSTLGWKAANVPLVRGQSPPAELFWVDRRRVVGLTMNPGEIILYRRSRQQHLGVPGGGEYDNPAAVYEEMDEARRLFRRCGFAVVDLTDKPMERSADEILAAVHRRLGLPPVETANG